MVLYIPVKPMDNRPICNCKAYPFPHKVGGKCTGSDFLQFYFTHIKELCSSCNCNASTECEAATGKESIKEAECFLEAHTEIPSYHLPLKIEDIL